MIASLPELPPLYVVYDTAALHTAAGGPLLRKARIKWNVQNRRVYAYLEWSPTPGAPRKSVFIGSRPIEPEVLDARNAVHLMPRPGRARPAGAPIYEAGR